MRSGERPCFARRASSSRELGRIVDQVAFVEHDDLVALEQLGPVAPELAADRDVVGLQVAPLEQHRLDVEQMDQDARAFDVAQELVAESGAFAGPFDQTRNVGDDASPFVALDHPERRDERREGIVGDARLRSGDPAQQRRFTGVRESDEADVGHQLEREPDAPALAGLARRREVRGLARRGLEARIAEAAAAATRDDDALAVARQVGDRRLLRVEGIASEDLLRDRARVGFLVGFLGLDLDEAARAVAGVVFARRCVRVDARLEVILALGDLLARGGAGVAADMAGGRAGDREILERVDEGSDRDVDFDGCAGGALLVGAAAGLSIRGLDAASGLQVEQRRHVRIGDEHDVPAPATVAAVRSAVRDVLLASERDVPVPSRARLDFEQGLVDEEMCVLHDRRRRRCLAWRRHLVGRRRIEDGAAVAEKTGRDPRRPRSLQPIPRRIEGEIRRRPTLVDPFGPT